MLDNPTLTHTRVTHAIRLEPRSSNIFQATLLAARHTLPTDPFPPKTYGCSARTPGRYNLRMLRCLPAHRAFPRRGHFDTLGPRHSTTTPDFPDFSVIRPFRYVTQQGSSPLVGLAPHRSLLMQLDRRCACQCGSLTCSCFGFEFWSFGVQMFPAT